MNDRKTMPSKQMTDRLLSKSLICSEGILCLIELNQDNAVNLLVFT